MASKSSRSKKSGLTPAQRKVLQEKAITQDAPGTILRDFETLLNFAAEREAPVSGTYGLLSINLVRELNARMAHPLDIKLQRPILKSYPNLNGLYLLLRASGLSRLENAGKGHRLRLDEKSVGAWRELNSTQQYFTLLEIWLHRAKEEIIGEHHGAITTFFRTASFLQHLPAEGRMTVNKSDAEGLRFYPGLHNLALLKAFGLVEVKTGETTPGKGWNVEHVQVTPFGDAIFALLRPDVGDEMMVDPLWAGLLRLFEPDRAGSPSDEDANLQEQPFGAWQALFQPFFPEWRHNLTLPEEPKQEGVYVFKVSLGHTWRSIAIPSQLTLEALSLAILDAFNFDNDHLHSFIFRDRFGMMVEVNHPMMDEPPFSSVVTVGELPLRPGDTMIFLFDFGDNWEFRVSLERIDPPNARMKNPRVLERHGKAPKQYHNWD